MWCVLVAEGRRSVARLELYEHKQMSVKEGSNRRKADYKQVIRMRECIRISENEMNDCPKDCATFFLETTDKLYVFAAHQSEAQEWIKCLCEQAFPVGRIQLQHEHDDHEWALLIINKTLHVFQDTQTEQRFPRQSGDYPEMQENSLYETADSGKMASPDGQSRSLIIVSESYMKLQQNRPFFKE